MGLDLLTTLRFIHITGAAVWAGGGVFLLASWAILIKRGQGVQFIRDLERLGPYVAMPAVAALLGSGIWMVIEADHIAFSDWWVATGLGLLIGAFVLAGADPWSRRALRLSKEHGDDHPDVAAAVAGGFRLTVVETLMLFAALFIMVARHAF